MRSGTGSHGDAGTAAKDAPYNGDVILVKKALVRPPAEWPPTNDVWYGERQPAVNPRLMRNPLATKESQGERPCETLLVIWRKHPLRMLGIGFYLAWLALAATRMPSVLDYANAPFTEEDVRLVLSATASLWLVANMFFHRTLDAFRKRQWVLAFAASAGSVGTLLLYLAVDVSPSFPLLLGSGLVLGFGTSVLLLSWGELFSKMDVRRLLGHILVSCLFSALLALFALSLPFGTYLAITVALPVFSGLTLIFCSDEPGRERVGEARWGGRFIKLLASCFVVSIALSLIQSTSEMGSALGGDMRPLYVVEAIIVCAVSAFILLIRRDPHTPPVVVLYRASIFLLVVGYLLLPFVPEGARIGMYGVASTGNLFFFRLIWLVYPLVVIRFTYSEVRFFGWCEVAHHLGVLVGRLLHMAAASAFSNENMFLFVCVAAVLSIFLMSHFMFSEIDAAAIARLAVPCEKPTGEPEREEPERPERALSDMLDGMARDLGLTARETEVFSLLARGRSLPYIERELKISNSTVKTHVRHVYEKMGVSNRQSFHDEVEKVLGENEVPDKP